MEFLRRGFISAADFEKPSQKRNPETTKKKSELAMDISLLQSTLFGEMKPHLFGLFPEDLRLALLGQGSSCTPVEARRIQARFLGEGRLSFDFKTPLKKDLQERLKERFDWGLLKIVERIEDPFDRSVRYLFEARDGALIEAVKIPLLKCDHFSVCLSSQAGCAMACDFCATGRLGLRRHLEAWEIVAQFWQIRQETKGRVSGAVFMGQGEPFHNYDNVIRAADLLSTPNGCRVDAKKITLSTVGLAPQIDRYAAENQPYRLIVSLISAVQKKRERLLPAAVRWPLPKLIASLRNYGMKTGGRITLAWVLIKGFNTGPDEVEALQALSKQISFSLNLIDVNDARPDGYERADDSEREAFIRRLQTLKIPIIRRYSVGRARHSACGMLSGKRLRDLDGAD